MARLPSLEKLDALVYRCRGCGAWRLPYLYMRKPHKCAAEYLQEQETE